MQVEADRSAKRATAVASITFVIAAWLLAPPGSADVVRDGSLGPAADVQPTGPAFVIPAEHGEYANGGRSNLFHSFARFDLTAEQSATFTGPVDVRNILARITALDASSIDGLVGSTIDGANLFLINPNGFPVRPERAAGRTRFVHRYDG